MRTTNPALSTFLGLYAILFILGLYDVWTFDKGDWVIWSDQMHQPWLDHFFRYLTYLGDGVCLAILCLLFCLFRYKYAIILTVIGLLQLTLSYLLKKVVFGRTLRPAAFLEGQYDFHFVEGVRIHHHYSFPSGHTMTAFGLFFFIALVNQKRSIAVACFIIATLAAYSRIYLAQHFLVDTVAGSLVGICLTGLIYWLAYVWQPFWKNQALNRPMA
ncbi:MAG: phosphatase PAP2 family protein [Bacteroidota bacterium]